MSSEDEDYQYGFRKDNGEIRWFDNIKEAYDWSKRFKKSIIRRKIGPIENVPITLPKAAGSLIAAKIPGNDKTIYAMCNGDDFWVVPGLESGLWFKPSDFTDVTIIFDAETDAGYHNIP